MTLFAAPLTRRQVLQSGVATAMLAMFGGPVCAATGGAWPLGFKPTIAIRKLDGGVIGS